MSGVVAYARFDEPDDAILEAARGEEVGTIAEVGVVAVGFRAFQRPLELHDPFDLFGGILLAVGATSDGLRAILVAPDTDDVNELERRIVRCLGDGVDVAEQWQVLPLEPR